ncbi:MAG: hypothetical protein HY908_07010 [Myxococcales bacterium]|nr:hypothetical protein [Myxococcales bacterium]
MAALNVKIEWEAAEGVTHAAFARTWARLEVDVAGECVTTVHDPRNGATRSGVYGPAILLAEWIVRNFWFLQWECAPAGNPGASWLRRHSLAAAREGTSLPDLRLFRDEDRVVAEWNATRRSGVTPVTFVASGRQELDVAIVRNALAGAVDVVLERLRGEAHPDALALVTDWDAIAGMSGDEATLCKRTARLGLDALNPRDLTEEIEHVLLGPIASLPEATRDDLLDAGVRAPLLPSTVAAVRGLVDDAQSPRLRGGTKSVALTSLPAGPPAYTVGYAAARDLRRRSASPGTARLDLPDLLAALGIRDFHEDDAALTPADPRIQAVVGFAADGAPRLLSAPRPRLAQRRFLVARGLFAVAAGAAAKAPRVLTAAGTRLQAATRAFAAELLAPAEMLRERLTDGLADDRLDDLADEFGVAATVIQHQIDNHGLGASG